MIERLAQESSWISQADWVKKKHDMFVPVKHVTVIVFSADEEVEI